MEARLSRSVRLLTAAQTSSAVGDGCFYVTAALFLTRVAGLTATQAGLWLSIAWGAAFLLSTPLGALADVVGLRRSAAGLSAVIAATLVVLPLLRSPAVVLVVLVAYATAQSGLVAVRQAIVAAAAPAQERVALRARLHVAVNAGIGVGAVIGGVALAVGTPRAYAIVLWADAVGFAVATVLLLRMPTVRRPTAARAAVEGRRRSVLQDRPYLLAAALNAALYLYMPMLSVVLPVFLTERTFAPRWAVAAVFVVNTLGVIALQVRAARTVTSIATATLAVRRGGLALAASALVFGAAAVPGSATPVLALLLCGAAVQVVGEVLLGAGSWHLGFALADPDRPGQWQGLYSSGLPLARAAGPLALSALVLGWTGPGWVVLATVFATTGAALRPVAVRAERRLPTGGSEPLGAAAPTPVRPRRTEPAAVEPTPAASLH